ncbi:MULTISPECIES: hypothetical protein [Pseudomonas syringae group]|uniref:Uncharacterized protein n=2 Tax=Pseudomonas syringae group TaxID=136849 RepID=A0AAW4E1G9_PSESX|nr:MULTISPECIES: hypothetical protein [Pseudomonas syringae group]EEB56890.1 hypothetical protein PSPTOT1_0810 [Pseudomonas syringae pv. tomato T1]KGK92354.1 hypothetical protein NB04_27250 [Pseudomonas syringae pv. tomato]KUR44902.1 hypothetical protein PST407_04043 [Pseudomonas syringae pv. tomato]KUR47119.1 hypothetical protein PSTA9_01846 [Pseudomonas syringae pv. tomato]MBI6701082.1 hypothetical protein [Pseudomonas syringae]
MATVKTDKTSGDELAVQSAQVMPAAAPVARPASSSASPVAVRTFRDRLYTSRTLILPDDRTLTVAKGIVTAQADDAVAMQCLSTHPDLEPLE